MKEKRITTRTAILAMENGFKINNGEGWFYKSNGREIWTNNKGGISGKQKTYSKCSQTLLQKWLRDKHKIHLRVMEHGDGVHYWCCMVDLVNDPNENLTNRLSYKYYKENEGAKYKNFEQALEVGLYDALKFIQNERRN